MGPEAMEEIADIMALTLKNPENESVREEARRRVAALTERYPLYADLTVEI